MLTFSPTTNFGLSTVGDILKKSYAKIQNQIPDKDWNKLIQTFEEFDQEVATNPHVAKCTFITEIDKTPIGLGSYDPRQRPEYGLIGHNAILPSVQGKGYGKMQLLEILNRMREMGIKKARVTTGDHPFFASAKKMYESVGFHETRKFTDKDWSFGQIEYEMNLNN